MSFLPLPFTHLLPPDDGHEEDEGGGGGERWILILLPEQHASVAFQGYIFTQTGQYDDAEGK